LGEAWTKFHGTIVAVNSGSRGSGRAPALAYYWDKSLRIMRNDAHELTDKHG